jgi:hypothetical protein
MLDDSFVVNFGNEILVAEGGPSEHWPLFIKVCYHSTGVLLGEPLYPSTGLIERGIVTCRTLHKCILGVLAIIFNLKIFVYKKGDRADQYWRELFGDLNPAHFFNYDNQRSGVMNTCSRFRHSNILQEPNLAFNDRLISPADTGITEN